MAEIKPFTGVDNRTILADVIPLNTPYTIGISPSNRCNFKCNYCVQSMPNNLLHNKYNFKREDMNMETFEAVVQSALEFPVKIKLLTFMGQGEPLLNKNLSKMILLAKTMQISNRIDIVTNASLLTPKKSDELINSGVDAIRISLQGLSSEKYKSISNVKLNFNKFIENIKYFYNNSRGKCEIYVKIMNTSLDKDEDKLFYDIFDSISDRMFIEQLKPVYDGVDYSEYNYSLQTDRRGNEHEKRYVCPQPFFTMSIWPNGEVIPCSAIHKVCNLGNVNSIKLIDMWNSLQLKSFQKMQLKKLRYNHPQCKLCVAPDDCAHLEDSLDFDSIKILERFDV